MPEETRVELSVAPASQVADVACALVPEDDSVWLIHRDDDGAGPEGRVCARRLGADGVALTAELVVARGSRGAVVPGGVAAMHDGGAAVAWRGDEGRGWLARLEPGGRLRLVSYLDPCDGVPALAALNDGTPLVAVARAGAMGVVAQRMVAAGAARAMFEGPRGSVEPAVTSDPAHGAAVACCVLADRALSIEDERGLRVTVPMPNTRIVPRVPALVRAESGRLACAFVGEDTGRLALYVGNVGDGPVRQADVWAPLERIAGSAPSLCALPDGTLVVAWREERGPRPAVYLRRLDATCHAIGPEVRVTARGAIAPAGRVGLVATRDGGWLCAHVEHAGEPPTPRIVITRAT